MTVTLELSPEELALLNNCAEAQGVDIETLLHALIAQLAPPPSPVWPLADATDDAEDQAERDREMAEFKANINRWRAEQGQPALP